MLDRYDHLELLNLIEGDLDGRSRAVLQGRLASDPAARAAVEAMVRHRAMLREVPEPALPQDFLAQIEPMLVRPMLIESVAEIGVRPEDFRRKHRKRRMVFRPMRLAAAAIFALGVLGGSWALIDSLMGGSTARSEDALAMQRPTPAPRSAPTPSGVAPRSDASSDELFAAGVIHHARPPVGGDPVVEERATNIDMNAGTRAGELAIIVAEFAVVVHADPADQVETSISNVAAAFGAEAALVRNFSYPDAQRLAEEYRLAHGGARRTGEQPVVAQAPGVNEVRETAISRSELQQLAQHVREQLRIRAATGDSPAEPMTLAGAASLGPTLEQQLDFSSRGASYTLAVHASALSSLIERLALDQPRATTLRMLPAAASAAHAASSVGDVSPMLVWLTEGPLVRQAIARLSQTNGETIILVPVILR